MEFYLESNGIVRVFDTGQVYFPGEDTYLLIAAAKEEVRSADRVLEIGTGSGYVASSIQSQVSFLLATDINPHATISASLRGIEVVQTDLAGGIRAQFDLVLFNPPYLPTLSEERMEDWLEYALDGGPDGTVVIRRFADVADSLLASEGRILLLVSSLIDIDAIRDLFEIKGMKSEVVAKEVQEDREVLSVLRMMRKES